MELVAVMMSQLCYNYVTAWSLYTLKDINFPKSTQDPLHILSTMATHCLAGGGLC